MKKIISFVLGLSIISTVSVYATSPVFGTFNDYSSLSFYYDSIELLAEKGIVQGYSDGSYGYNDTINRAEFMKILVETKYLAQNKEFLNSYTDEGCFSDVKADVWYTGYICYAASMDWVSGYPDGSFRPGDNINFVEAVKIVLNTLDIDYDGGIFDPWYRGMVEAAGVAGLIPMTIRDFGQNITRSEMADMIARKINSDDGKLEVDNIYSVTYETINAGVDVYENWLADRDCAPWPGCVLDMDVDDVEESDDPVLDVLTIVRLNADVNSVMVELDGPSLGINELYHFECLQDGKSPMFAKMLNTTSKTVTFDNLFSNTLYGCWVALLDSGGNESMTTGVKGVETLGAFEKVQIIEYSATHESITIRVKPLVLNAGETYFAECVEVGSSEMFFPELKSTSTTMVLKGGAGDVKVNPDTEYSCYVAVSPASGVNKYFSNSFNITTYEPKLDIVTFEVFSSYVKFDITPVDLNEGEYYYAQCLKDGNESPYGNPHDSGTGKSFEIYGFKSNTDYECTVEIRGSEDPDYQPSKILGLKTKPNVDQVPFTKAYTGSDANGVYIVVGTSANINADETYFYSCNADDESESVMEVTHDKEKLLRVSASNAVYWCSISVGSEYFSHDISEYIWLVTP